MGPSARPTGAKSQPLPSPCMMNGPFRRYEVRLVYTDPLLLLLVPPDVLLALAPRPTLGVGRRPVVEDAAIVRPHPAPLRGHYVLVARRLAPSRLVYPLGVGARVDPTAARRRTIRREIQEVVYRLAVGDGVAVYLL